MGAEAGGAMAMLRRRLLQKPPPRVTIARAEKTSLLKITSSRSRVAAGEGSPGKVGAEQQ